MSSGFDMAEFAILIVRSDNATVVQVQPSIKEEKPMSDLFDLVLVEKGVPELGVRYNDGSLCCCCSCSCSGGSKK
jgi:hypothetical protein